MNICKMCDYVFTDEEAIKEVRESFEKDNGIDVLFKTDTEYTAYKCPRCESLEVEEAFECENCGEYCSEEDIIDTYESLGVGYLCPDCHNDAMMDR